MNALGQTTIIDGGIACIEIGPVDARALVCCHGMALDHRDLLDLVAPLAAEWRIVLWDMPGHGASGPRSSRCTLDTMTDALESVLKHLKLSTPVLLGFSFGGMVAQALLRRRTCDVRALIGMACFAPYSVDPPLAADTVEDVLIASINAAPWDQVRARFARACSAREDVQSRLLPAIDRSGRDGLAVMTRALINGFHRDASFAIDVPLLVIRGADDANGEALVASARAMLEASSGGQELVLENAGHCVHLDKAQEVQSAVVRFLTQL